MPNFIVHFRRPDDYKGEYGFDWLRDEYVYDLTHVVIQNKNIKLLTSNQEKLITEYRTYQGKPLDGIDEIGGSTYTPEWLSVLPQQTVGLYLQIDQAENDASSLSDDGETLLSFECSAGLQLTLPHGGKSIALKDVVKNIEPTHIDLSFKEFNRYEKALRITIKCESPLPSLGYIKVFAKKNNPSNLVGLLLVYPNQQALTTTIYPVYLSNTAGQNSNSNPNMVPSDLADSICHRFLNQALVHADVKPLDTFNIVDIYNGFLKSRDFYSDEFNKLYAFITNYYQNPSYGLITQLFPRSVQPEQFTADLIELYELLMPNSAPIGGIYHKDSKATYLFFTEHYADGGETKGIADGQKQCQQGTCKMDWGNAVTVFNHTNINGDEPSHTELTHTIIHELGHSYGLYHTFIQNELSINSPHTFFRGYTDNIMDYRSFQLPQDVIDKWRANPTAEQPENDNPRINTMFSLFKWQWDIIQNDKSIQRGQSYV